VYTDDVITLKFHHHQNPDTLGDQALIDWAHNVEVYAGGKVKIEIYGAQTLGKGTDAYDMVTNGIADIAWSFIPYFPGVFPISEGVALPMMGMQSSYQASSVLQEFYDESPEMQAEYSNVHVLYFHSHDPAPIGTKSKKIETSSDLKGLQIRVTGDGQTKMIQALGASAVPISLSDLYQSLEKGVVDGYTLGWEGINGFNLLEVTKYMLNAKYYSGGFWNIMNKDVWESLPTDVQEAFTKASGMTEAQRLGKIWDLQESQTEEKALGMGVEINYLSDTEMENWAKIAVPIQKEWADNITAQGLDGDALLQQIKDLIAKYAE
jgi:TRAP-type C4-dicarboxylate transport system substrate-binding protein